MQHCREGGGVNVFIIGPEGAGKTVFATMLNAYVAQHPECGIVSRDADLQTKKYLAGEFSLLEQGEWPGSTKGGRMVSLNWRWAMDGQTVEVGLIDPAGQDIRRDLCGDTNALQIVESIAKADVLILLVDLHGHQSGNGEKRIENGWIVEHVLDRLRDHQSLVFAVTKADMLTGSLPRAMWGDCDSVLQLVGAMMPEFNLAGYSQRLRSSSSAVLAFSSVSTTENRDQGGSLVRFPRSPLASDGMDMVVNAILTICRRARGVAEETARKERQRRRLRLACVIAACMATALLLYLGAVK
jgi:energy-coupling factor transporter ATP-binding protein EcfA2